MARRTRPSAQKRKDSEVVARTKPPSTRSPGAATQIAMGGSFDGTPASRPETSARLGRLYDRILEALARVESGEPADRALDHVFRAARDLGQSERQEVSERVYEVLRSTRAADDLLERGARAERRRLDIVDAPVRLRLRVLAARLLAGATLDDLIALDPYAARRIPGLFERLARGAVVVDPRRDAVDTLAIETSLPAWFVRRLHAALGPSRAAEIAHGLVGRAPLTIRVNTLRLDREALAARLLEEEGAPTHPTPLAPHGLILDRRVALEQRAAFQAGLFEVQDEGSQLIAEVLGARPGELVVDACAGAGGKTLALACAMAGTGRLLCFDVDDDKLEELRTRARRAGLSNCETQARDFVLMPPELVGRADRVLVDAPCTGTGTLRRQIERRLHLDESELEKAVPRQRALLTRAIDAVKLGGIVVYATCSVLAEENEHLVQAVLEADPRLAPHPLTELLSPALVQRLEPRGHELRIGPGPSDDGPDGFYVAALRRVAP